MKPVKKGIFLIYKDGLFYGSGYFSHFDLKNFQPILMYDEQNFPLKQEESEIFDKIFYNKQQLFD